MLKIYHNIKGNIWNTIKQNKLNMASRQLNKTHKEIMSNWLNITKILKQTWKIIKYK